MRAKVAYSPACKLSAAKRARSSGGGMPRGSKTCRVKNRPVNAKPAPPHSHDGAEMIYMMRGALAVDIAGETTVLDEGDAMYFDSGAPHSYSRHGRSPARRSWWSRRPSAMRVLRRSRVDD